MVQMSVDFEASSEIDSPDDVNEPLMGAHQGRSVEDSYALNARLILLLANQIGSISVLRLPREQGRCLKMR